MKRKTVNRVRVVRNLLQRIWGLCVIGICMLSYDVHAAKACFTTTDTLGCVPYTVTMQECTQGGNSIQYDYDYEDNKRNFVASNVHIYTVPGKYKVWQLIQGTSGGNDNNYVMPTYIVVIAAVTPKFNILLCENRTISLQLTDQQFPTYTIDFGDGSPIVEVLPNSNNIHTYANVDPRKVVVTGKFLSGGCPTPASQDVTPVNSLVFEKFFKVVNTQDQPDSYLFSFNPNKNLSYSFLNSAGAVVKTFSYQDTVKSFNLSRAAESCYYFVAKTVCDESSTSFRICLEDLKYELSDTSVALSWQANDPTITERYEVFRDGVLLSRIAGTGQARFDDATVKCGKNYCYQLITKLKDSTSFSTQRCMTAVSNRIPDKPYNIVSSFTEDNLLRIRWLIPQNSSFKSAKLKSLLSNRFVLESRDTSYSSSVVEPTCYSLFYLDSCDKISEMVADICPIVLEAKPQGQGIYELNWNRYSPNGEGLEYQLFEEGKLIFRGSENSFVTLEKDTEHQIKTFKVVAITTGGIQVQSNTVKLEQEMKVFFPTAFSPNGDGLNDVFAPKTRFVKSIKLAIFNIWGELVFSGADAAAAWTGEHHSNGSYQYVADVEDFLGRQKQFRGQVTLVK